MNITAEKPVKSEIKLTVELSELEMETYRQKALEKLAKQVNVKGFRPGKVPLDVAAEQLDPGFVTAHAIDMAIPPTYVDAIKEKNIEPIARPKVTVVSDVPLKYEAIIPVYPEVKVKDYQKITLEKKPVQTTEQQVQEEIARFQGYHATYADVTDRAAQIGDRVEIDFEGFDQGGAPLEGTSSKNHPLVLGDKSFVPGFEENIIGLKLTEEKEFTVNFPADYFHKPFQNKPVKFKVKLNRIEQRNLPALDAELIKKITNKEMSEAEFRTEVKNNLQKQQEQDEQNRLESAMLEQIEAKTEVELPETLIDEEVHYMIDEQKDNLDRRGIVWADYLKATGKDEQSLHDEKHPEAEKRLRLRFGVQEIFKLEKVDVTDAELDQSMQDELKVLASMNYQPKIEEQDMLKNRLRNKIKMEKLIQFFLKK
jgi:trigger factor